MENAPKNLQGQSIQVAGASYNKASLIYKENTFATLKTDNLCTEIAFDGLQHGQLSRLSPYSKSENLLQLCNVEIAVHCAMYAGALQLPSGCKKRSTLSTDSGFGR